MPSYREIYLNMYGVWRLLHLDTAALGWFDSSLEGFWKSFFAALMVLPAFAFTEVLLPSQLPPDAAAASLGTKIAANAVTYVYLWIVWPVVMLPVCERMGRGDKYVRYIVAYNWALVWQYYFLLPWVVIAAAAENIGGTVLGIAHVLVFAFAWYIARTALAISSLAALGLLVLDIVLSILISEMNVLLMT